MYENQFLKFTKTIDPQECGMPLPVVFGDEGISFFADVNERPESEFTIVDASGVPFLNGDGETLSGRFRDMAGNYVRNMFGVYPTHYYSQGIALFHADKAREFVAPYECFRIRIGVPSDTQRKWLESRYPYNGIYSANGAFDMLGLEYDLYAIGSNIVIPTTEAQTYAVLSGMASASSIPKYEHRLYYTKDTEKYYAWNGSAFVDITDTPAITNLFGESAQELTMCITKGHNPLIYKEIGGSACQIIYRNNRTKKYNLHITGYLAAGHNLGSTGGKIIAAHRGVAYEWDEYRQFMAGIQSTGGVDLTGFTESEYNTLVNVGIELGVNSTYYEHTFTHEALHVNSVGDRFIYSASFVLYLSQVTYTYVYSNLLRRYENEDGGLSLLSYTCGTETFDLPFTTSRPIRQWLPIMVKDPQPEQKDEVYEKLSGERVVMFATINEKYKCETDYIPYEWHKRIVMALSCDIVKINGQRLTKSDSYEINWENYSKLECGTKITKAEWKMVANVTSRNSNN